MSGILIACCITLLLAAAWHLTSTSGLVPEYLLPAPQTVGETLRCYLGPQVDDNAFAGRMPGDWKASIGRVACGCLLAVPPAIILGLLSGRSPFTAALLAPIVHGMRAVPGISWLPLALLWLGVGFKTTVALIALAAFFPTYLNTAATAASIPKNLLRAGRMIGLKGRSLFWHVLLPYCMPGILAGMRLSLGISFSYLVLGELTGVPDGLGAMIMDARLTGRVDRILCGILVIAITGRICDILLVRAVRLFSAGARTQ